MRGGGDLHSVFCAVIFVVSKDREQLGESLRGCQEFLG